MRYAFNETGCRYVDGLPCKHRGSAGGACMAHVLWRDDYSTPKLHQATERAREPSYRPAQGYPSRGRTGIGGSLKGARCSPLATPSRSGITGTKLLSETPGGLCSLTGGLFGHRTAASHGGDLGTRLVSRGGREMAARMPLECARKPQDGGKWSRGRKVAGKGCGAS